MLTKGSIRRVLVLFSPKLSESSRSSSPQLVRPTSLGPRETFAGPYVQDEVRASFDCIYTFEKEKVSDDLDVRLQRQSELVELVRAAYGKDGFLQVWRR